MARVAGVTPALILPDAPEKYDVDNEREFRAKLKNGINLTVDYSTIVTVPTPVQQIAELPDISPFVLGLLDDASASEGRTTLDIREHRSAQIVTTASLADLATENGTLVIPDLSCDLIAVQVDRACRVRLYVSASARTDDVSRPVTTQPTAGTGVLAEFVATGAQTIPCSPVPRLANGDTVPVAQVYYAIQNTSGSSHTVQATFTFGALP